MIRACTVADAPAILEIINDGAEAYRGVIPEDRWSVPYMSLDHLTSEIADGVTFSGASADAGELAGVMGIQDKGAVCLIRHAYVRTRVRRAGIGSTLLKSLIEATDKPFLIGTWKAATWAISFYEKHGFRETGPAETANLLETYWAVPARQADVSVVLAHDGWSARAQVNRKF